MDTSKLIQEARELLAKCSEGEWSRNLRINSDCSYRINASSGIGLQTHFDGGLFPNDCDFIIFARNNLGALLDEMEKQTYLHNLDRGLMHKYGEEITDLHQKLAAQIQRCTEVELENARLKHMAGCGMKLSQELTAAETLDKAFLQSENARLTKAASLAAEFLENSGRRPDIVNVLRQALEVK